MMRMSQRPEAIRHPRSLKNMSVMVSREKRLPEMFLNQKSPVRAALRLRLQRKLWKKDRPLTQQTRRMK